MGCISAIMTPYTKEDLDIELSQMVPRLPMGELMIGGIIKLEGANGFFNPDSLLDPSWLKGKMTVEEYRQAINYINTTTAYTHIGLSRVYSTSERGYREQLRSEAGRKAVEDLNNRYSSVKFTYQVTAESIQMSTTWSTDPAVQMANRRKAPVGRSSLTILYIAIQ